MSFLNPAGAIVQAILAIYNVIMFFVENWQRIVDFVGSVFNSIGEIAAGKISAAASKVESAMTIPIILNFLARLLGLSGIGKAVSDIIKKIRKPIDKIVNKVLDKIVGFAKKLFKKGKVAAKGAAQSVINFVNPKHSFTAGEESHTISVKKIAGKKVLYIASTPSPIKSFLMGYEQKNKDSLSDKKKADIKAAKAYIVFDINPLLIAVGKLQETTANKKKNSNYSA